MSAVILNGPVVEPNLRMPQKIAYRLRYFGIKQIQDAFWLEEAEVNGVKFDQLTIDLSNWFVRGFEVKVSRGDFLQDRKWQNYLPYVNQFSFASTPGLILAQELPDGIGLVEYHDDTGTMTTIRKARTLQPSFLRRDLGSEFVIRLMRGFIRDVQWRASHAYLNCECGRQFSVLSARGPTGGRISL